MFRGRLTQAIIHVLDRMGARPDPAHGEPEHLRIGRRGEEDAYFYLRRRGYTMIARNYRSPNHRGEIDLVGWDHDVLCFIEVKTRTTRAVKPAEAAVDHDKRNQLRMVARDFLRHMPSQCPWRFDVLSIYYDDGSLHPTFELFQNAFSVAYNRSLARSY
jgi:putative endonuclease